MTASRVSRNAAAVLGVAVSATVMGCAGPNLLAGCQPVAPDQLPSGAPVGEAVEGVAGGTKQFTWGVGADRVDLRLGADLGEGDELLHEVTVNGSPGAVYQAMPEGQLTIGVVWTQDGCDYTVYLDDSFDAAELAAYAERY